MSLINANKIQFLRYAGDFSQLFGIKEYTLTGGKAKGVKAFDVRNGSGLEFTVLADRCLDIASLSLNGVNCSYVSKTGIVAPEFYNESGIGFFRSFFAGFLTTCGLRNVGKPCEDNDEFFGIHGRISNIPAEEVSTGIDWVNDLPVFTISGKMREASFFGENLVLHRKIICCYGENKISIRNTIENCGFQKEPLMILFHFNLGFPLLDENALLIMSSKKSEPRDEEAINGIKVFNKFQSPTPGYAEQVFYHNLRTDSKGNTCVAFVNEKLELAVALKFNKKQLLNFTQWKQMGEGEYVVGLEPGNCFVGGRSDAREKGTLNYLEPHKSAKYDLDIEFFSNKKDINLMIKYINMLNHELY